MIPDYQTLMLPALTAAAGSEISIRKVIDDLAAAFNLSPEERMELLPSGRQRTFDNRVSWARTYLNQAGLVHTTRRGHFAITNEGRRVLSQQTPRIDNRFLAQYQSFRDFRKPKTGNPDAREEQPQSVARTAATPDETLRQAYEQIHDALAADLLQRTRSSPPDFFENLIVKLLLAMGYGGSSSEAGRTIGRSGDNGVDGVIDQDPLGTDQIYVQAKRYGPDTPVGPSAIRDFFGALNLRRAQKGIFVTTSTFTESALRTARELGMRIVLIDGKRLAHLMLRHNVGCRNEDVLHLKKIDEDFFDA